MPSEDPIPVPFADFIDDYYVECDEHLAIARRCLLGLESFVDQPRVDRALLDELFRSFHSIKGLSAMVGVREAEQLSHHMESYLSVLRTGEAQLSPGGVDALINGIKGLEQILTARRGGVPATGMEEIEAQFADLLLVRGKPALLPSEVPAGESVLQLGADKEASIARFRTEGRVIRRLTFVPSASLAGRGVNVNSVRSRLQELGDVIHAAPMVRPGGQIAFSFVLASHAEQAIFTALQDDGISSSPWTPAPEPAGPRPNEQPPPASETFGAGAAPASVIRVDLARLDELMQMVGVLVISRARLETQVQRVRATTDAAEWRGLQETNLAIERQLRDLREGIMRVRLVPVREMFARMQFVVRDLTREFGKKVSLNLSGQETEIDKFVVERMMDPLLHLVRNAVSHGLEGPDERKAHGKAETGTLSLRASATGSTIELEVEDDGRGIDAGAVFAKARAAGLLAAETAPDKATLLDVLCAPGFSTRESADRASGRGVGMAVVRTVIEELGGSLTMTTRVGEGTRFTIQLPLTLAIADALIVEVAGQKYAVPHASVREVIQLQAAAAKSSNPMIPYRDGALPLMGLAAFFGARGHPGREGFALVVGVGASSVGLTVDRVLGLHEIVVRPLTDPLIRTPGVAGATELGDGRVVLILDTLALSRSTRRRTKSDLAPVPGFSSLSAPRGAF